MTETKTAFAPGRVNLIGEHTDYNAGLSLAFAIKQGITVRATPIAQRTVRVHTLLSGEHDQFDPVAAEPIHGWRGYVRGIVLELASEGVDVRGTEIEISSDLTPGVGLASSAALCVALATALTAAAGHEPLEDLRLARLCSRVENDWVGASTGLLDQIAVISSAPDATTLIDFQDLSTSRVPMSLAGHRLVIADSGERHAHGSSAYNQRRAECEQAAHRMRLETLRDATITDLHMLPDDLVGRARHVISEIGRVLNAVSALRAQDMEKLGMLLTQSQKSLRDDFQVSTPAVDRLVQTLISSGALGARGIGGGFGGSVLALLPPEVAVPDGAHEVVPCGGARLLA